MQLSTVKISNLFSFPYVDNLTSIEGVKFHNHENGIINTLIGPNGSGKSNLLNIITTIRKYGITISYTLDTTNPSSPRIITHPAVPLRPLSKHRGQSDRSSHVYMSVLLNQEDIHNLLFLAQYHNEINIFINTYSDSDIVFVAPDIDMISSLQKISLYCDITTDPQTITLHPSSDPVINFVYQYFQYFELISHCITLHNTLQLQPSRPPLRHTFAFITQANHNSNEPKSLRLLQKKYHNLTLSQTTTHSKPLLIQDFFLTALNNHLAQYVGYTITITHNELQLFTSNHEPCNYQELSSGEQSFMDLILFIYSHDLHNGLIIIDEPETHLHPQSQKEFLALIQEMMQINHMQVIIATHSPTLINTDTIGHVFRCTKDDDNTIIHSTNLQGLQSDLSFLQLLKFDHIAKIFFVDQIILVEGETDLYFFNYFLEYLSKNPERKHRIKNYEIITIGGKGGVKKWTKFLKKFDTRVSYIGDRDNSVEFGIVHPQELQRLTQYHLPRRGASKYSTTITYLKNHHPDRYHHIISNIHHLYKQHVYLLSQGDLESYIDTNSKSIEDTIKFCRDNFNNRWENSRYREKKQELLNIIGHVFTS